MLFLGSVKLDGSKRATLIKEVAEILDVKGSDYLDFFIDNGEIIIRKVLPERGDIGYNNASFWDWARKREIELDMLEKEYDSEIVDQLRYDLEFKIEGIKGMEEYHRSKINQPD